MAFDIETKKIDGKFYVSLDDVIEVMRLSNFSDGYNKFKVFKKACDKAAPVGG